jgi:gas vesicle protein
MSDNSNSGSSASVLVAFVVGALAGAAIALLYAPASGEETRRRLAEKARQGRDKAQQMAGEGREFIERQRDRLVDVAERGREAFEQTRKESL